MKRTLISLLTLTALVLSLLVLPVQAAGQTELTGGQWKNGKFSVTFNAPSATSATLMAAAYENGRMVQVETKEVKGGGNVTFDRLRDTGVTRVFALDPKNSQPLCEKAQVVDPDALVVYQGTVTLPTADPEVTRALSSALSSYAQVMLALLEVDRYLTETDAGGKTRLDAVASSSGRRLLPGGIGKSLPRRPDQGSVSVPTMAPVLSKPVAHPAFDASMDQVNAALDACSQMVKANAVLEAAAEQEAAALQSEVKAMETASLQGGVSDEQLEWAQAITEHYDAIESNKKIAQLAKDMGCDAKRAYAQLVMAQNILKGQYSKEEGDLNELWEKRMIATKAGCKVGLFVCATIATGGATAASPAGFVSLGEAAGIVVGAVDATIEVSTAGTKIILGPDSKVAKTLEDKFKPVSDACLLFGLFTGGGSTAGEQLAFLGDLNQRKDELYDNIKLKYNVDLKQMEAEVLTLNPLDPTAALKLAEKLLPAGTDLGLAQEARDMTVNEVLEEFSKDRPCDDAFLEDLIEDLDLDVDLEEVAEEFEKEVNDELMEDFSDWFYYGDDGFDHFYQSYDYDGNLIREYYYGADRRLEWEKFYDGPTGQLTMEQFYSDGPEGRRLVSVYTYYPAEEVQGNPEGGQQLKGFSVHEYPNFQENYYGDLGNGEFGQSYVFYPDGRLQSHGAAGYSENYEGNNELSSVGLSNEDGTTTFYTYYTSVSKADPKGLGYRILDETSLAYVHPAGHLREVKVIQPNPGSVTGSHTIYDFGYSVASWAVEGGTAYGYISYETGVNSSGNTNHEAVYTVSTGE